MSMTTASTDNGLTTEWLDWCHCDTDDLFLFCFSDNDETGCSRKYEFKMDFPRECATTKKDREKRRTYRRTKQHQDQRPGKEERGQYKKFIDNLKATMNQNETYDPSTVELPKRLQNCAKLQRDLKAFLAEACSKTKKL